VSKALVEWKLINTKTDTHRENKKGGEGKAYWVRKTCGNARKTEGAKKGKGRRKRNDRRQLAYENIADVGRNRGMVSKNTRIRTPRLAAT